MFNLGDKVWYANIQHSQIVIVCPDCCGKKYLTVILGDNSQVTIDCTTCSSGYTPPSGWITSLSYISNVRGVIIDNIEVSATKVEYGFDGCFRVSEDEVFLTQKEAEDKAKELVIEHKKTEENRLQKKEKPNHSWAWHVTYHKQQIRNAEKELKYHTAKLNAAITENVKPDGGL